MPFNEAEKVFIGPNRKKCHPILPKLLLVTAAFIDSAIVLRAMISWNNRISKLYFKTLKLKGASKKCDMLGAIGSHIEEVQHTFCTFDSTIMSLSSNPSIDLANSYQHYV